MDTVGKLEELKQKLEDARGMIALGRNRSALVCLTGLIAELEKIKRHIAVEEHDSLAQGWGSVVRVLDGLDE